MARRRAPRGSPPGNIAAVAMLRRSLYVIAALWALLGLCLAVVPKLLVTRLAGLPTYPEYAWVRVSGLEALTIAMTMVLVANRVRELWWWSWAFVLGNLALMVFALLKAGLGLGSHGRGTWWVVGGFCALEALFLMIGMLQAGREEPL